jgi:hypothetical protein
MLRRRPIRGMGWAAKGLLLAVALAALFAWPWSWGHRGRVELTRWTARTTSTERRLIAVGCEEGRFDLQWGTLRLTNAWLSTAGDEAARHGPGWAWTWEPGSTRWNPLFAADSSWKIFSSGAWTTRSGSSEIVGHAVAFPCWLLALVAGAWPCASLALFVRRRRRARRLALVGCCRRCGYDLRATPEAGGAMLATCPECGRSAAAAASRRP